MKVSRLLNNQAFLGWMLVLPAVVILGTFFFYPMIYALVLSFFSWNLLGAKTFVGFANYAFLFSDPEFRRALWNTVYFTVFNLAGTFVLSLGVALLVTRESWGYRIFRTVSLMPLVIPMVITGIIWGLLLEPTGVINVVLDLVGIEGKEWLYNSKWAMPAIILVSIWHSFGLYILLFVAGLQTIPDELYEAASIDGAGRWKSFRHITLPMLKPTTFFVLTLLLINSFKAFDTIWVMTQGGPGNSTTTLVVYMYQKIFTSVGDATAASIVLFLIIFVLVLFQYSLMGREEKYS
ncbi:MAG TPA: sugar ABC transporter permease [Paenibacillaceae bacterium]